MSAASLPRASAHSYPEGRSFKSCPRHPEVQVRPGAQAPGRCRFRAQGPLTIRPKCLLVACIRKGRTAW